MSGMTLSFFIRQLLASTAGTATDHYSPPFEVTDFASLTVLLQVLSSNPAAATFTATVQHTNDPTLGDSSWITAATITVNAAGGTGQSSTTISNPFRFVRVKLNVASSTYGTVLCEGVARTA